MIRFYAPDIESDPVLPEAESAHCVRVLRMREGDTLEIVDGKGGLYSCVLKSARPKAAEVEITSKSTLDRHWKPEIIIAVAPTKNTDRMEWLAEKATEIGVDKLVFLNCERSVRKTTKPDRIEKILVSAMKQSLKALKPELEVDVPILEFIDDCSKLDAIKYVGYCDASVERRDFSACYSGQENVVILIGPEGDFSPSEIKAAISAGFIPVTFGDTRLRTETAALFALCATHTLIDRFESGR
ncbi:MAG: 16S rRNA (uracil(1498)-N(3))-methyltransferase [Muribaculaceae bacterium]|nr:16S rRNA (uracil(1498)-N(3))-methyltransferase [Muribaculaceae bacterium]